MKFGFIGGTERGYTLIKTLVRDNFIPEFCVVLKEDDHEKSNFSDLISEFISPYKIPVSIKKRLSDNDYERIKKLSLDFIIVCGWRTMINPELNLFLKHGMIAAHDSLLPRYRGFAPLNWAIINGEKKTGVTLFKISSGDVDTGEIVLQQDTNVGPDETVNEVNQKIISITCELYRNMIKSYILNGVILSSPQDETNASYTCKRTPEDGRINWNDNSQIIYNLIRALVHPYSGAFFLFKNQAFEVRSAKLGPQNMKNFVGRIPGRVISINDNGVEVLCGLGTVLIKEVFDVSNNKLHMANELFKSITIKFT